jgi:hypothetical protein
LYVGSIEIWSIDRRQSVKRDVNAIDSPLAWFPDGKRLAYVKLADSRAVAARRDETFARKFRNWEKIPSVYVWDVDAGTETFLHFGSAPVVSQDGRFVLISEYDSGWAHVRVDVATGEPTSVNYHGSNRAGASVIAIPARDVVLASDMIWSSARVRKTHCAPIVARRFPTVLTSWLGGRRRASLLLDIVSLFANDGR